MLALLPLCCFGCLFFGFYRRSRLVCHSCRGYPDGAAAGRAGFGVLSGRFLGPIMPGTDASPLTYHVVEPVLRTEGTMNRQLAVPLLCLVGVAIYANVRWLLDTYQTGLDRGQRWILLIDQKGPEIKKLLPSRGVVGFTHPYKRWDGAAKKWADDDDQERQLEINSKHLITRYALAPVFVERGVDYPLVIGWFKDAAGEPKEEEGLHPVHDFGDGIKLYRRKGQ
jgi:hypothetical protein